MKNIGENALRVVNRMAITGTMSNCDDVIIPFFFHVNLPYIEDI